MSDPFIAEIKIFAGNFAPRGWAFCNGTLLPISQNTALFALIGTTYGGDGRTTMGLPNLKGRAPMHAGNGPGLTNRRLGEKSGTETVTLTVANKMPAHSHNLSASASPATGFVATTTSALARSVGGASYNDDGSPPLVSMHESALGEFGTNSIEAHNNMQPFLTLNFIIALVGVFPSRN